MQFLLAITEWLTGTLSRISAHKAAAELGDSFWKAVITLLRRKYSRNNERRGVERMVNSAYPKPSSSEVECNFLNLLPPQRAIMVLLLSSCHRQQTSICTAHFQICYALWDSLLITTTKSFHQNFQPSLYICSELRNLYCLSLHSLPEACTWCMWHTNAIKTASQIETFIQNPLELHFSNKKKKLPDGWIHH